MRKIKYNRRQIQLFVCLFFKANQVTKWKLIYFYISFLFLFVDVVEEVLVFIVVVLVVDVVSTYVNTKHISNGHNT